MRRNKPVQLTRRDGNSQDDGRQSSLLSKLLQICYQTVLYFLDMCTCPNLFRTLWNFGLGSYQGFDCAGSNFLSFSSSNFSICYLPHLPFFLIFLHLPLLLIYFMERAGVRFLVHHWSHFSIPSVHCNYVYLIYDLWTLYLLQCFFSYCNVNFFHCCKHKYCFYVKNFNCLNQVRSLM